jgi:aminopeptidase N
MRHSLYLAASLVALATAARAEAPFNFDRTPGKLPKNVVPSAYTIDIAPDLTKLTLAGSESIEIEVRQATPAITLNQAGLTLTRATLEDGSAAKITEDEKAQTATLTFATPVAAGKHTLKIVYNGPTPRLRRGFITTTTRRRPALPSACW